MLKFLGKLLNRDLTSPSEPIDTNVSEDEIWEILHPTNKTEQSRKKKNLQNFLRFITSHLSKTESQRLCRVAKKALDDEEVEAPIWALSEVIRGENGQRRGRWVFIQLDWKAREEIEWQVSEVLSARGLECKWDRNCLTDFDSVPQALIALSVWLSERSLALLHLDTESDSYCCFVVKGTEIGDAKELGALAELKIFDHDEFTKQYP
ncbi:MAG: hypothetical protein A2286_00720 [Gammaproteobacteria bacterium RIFOXYA12_FULL_61_12]|nr:MAG: hypothetical protein A2514_08835 [Gammaproteobacteria bacterium RIFOXYD12_FULL_61_37]OGT94136.1 MAG: hypothetical protein A2286_00720 [Gammaproteobacteria bacterium RIFOXYA12_FULL_61_12]